MVFATLNSHVFNEILYHSYAYPAGPEFIPTEARVSYPLTGSIRGLVLLPRLQQILEVSRETLKDKLEQGRQAAVSMFASQPKRAQKGDNGDMFVCH